MLWHRRENVLIWLTDVAAVLSLALGIMSFDRMQKEYCRCFIAVELRIQFTKFHKSNFIQASRVPRNARY